MWQSLEPPFQPLEQLQHRWLFLIVGLEECWDLLRVELRIRIYQLQILGYFSTEIMTLRSLLDLRHYFTDIVCIDHSLDTHHCCLLTIWSQRKLDWSMSWKPRRRSWRSSIRSWCKLRRSCSMRKREPSSSRGTSRSWKNKSSRGWRMSQIDGSKLFQS